jgi:hypothetical protein
VVFEDYSNPYLITKEKNAWRDTVSEKRKVRENGATEKTRNFK